MKPAAGAVAPEFTAPVIGGQYLEEDVLTLSSFRGKRVVLVFYPKDNTPGCTTQACALRDNWDVVQKEAVVLGVSVDSIKSHQKFLLKEDLPYPLVADENKEIVQAYGVWVEKKMYGKSYMGTERSTFIIESDGSILAVLEKVKPKLHLEQVLEVLSK